MGARQVASHNDYVKLEAHVEAGKSVYEAAKLIGLPLGAFKTAKGDREWYEQIAARVETVRAGMVDERIDHLVMKEEPNAAIVKAWASANHPEYRDRTEVNVSGEIGVNHPDLIASFDSWVAKLAELAARRSPALGAGNGAGEAAPAAALPLAAVERKAGAATTGG